MTSVAERVWNYTYDILEGVIPASKKHKQACRRFLDDIERIPEKDYPYTFDIAILEDFNEWCGNFKHTKGVLAGEYIELTDFQLFVCANIFCWISKDKGLRRFRYIYVQLGRKNAKSQLLALIASYVAFLSDEQEEVYVGGVTKEQSQIVYKEILTQINACKLLRWKYKSTYDSITHIKSGSTISALSKEARKTGDGKNPSLAIIDEYHAHPTDEIYEVMKSGMVARKQPLMVIITTAGFDLNTPCYKEYEYVSRVLNPEDGTTNEEYFAMICELDPEDDIKDESLWIKANPIVATYEEGLKSIRGDLQIALEIPEKMTKFLTKNINRWVQMKQGGYMNLEKWNACGVKAGNVMPDLRGREVYIGIDLSATLDLTSVGFEIPVGDNKYVVLGHSFLPEGTLAEKIRLDKQPYDAWIRQGWLSATEGETVDYNFVQKYIEDIVEEYGWDVKAIYFDDWNATQFINNMQNAGFETVKVIQGLKTLAPPTKDFRDKVYKREIIHDDNPLLKWSLGNAITKLDQNANFWLDKKNSREKIDPIASVLNAHVFGIYHYTQEDFSELYDDDYLDKLLDY